MALMATFTLRKNLFDAIDSEDVSSVEKILRAINSLPDVDILNEKLIPHCEMTALHLAVGLNSIDISTLLLKYGSDPNSVNCSEKSSPLHLSVLYDYEDLVSLLISAGGNPSARDGGKNSCYDLILKNPGLDHLLQHLQIKGAEKENTPSPSKAGLNFRRIATSPNVYVQAPRNLHGSTYFSPSPNNPNTYLAVTTDESYLTCQTEPSTPMSMTVSPSITLPSPRLQLRQDSKVFGQDNEKRRLESPRGHGLYIRDLVSDFAQLMTEDESESTAISMTTTTASSYSSSTSPSPTDTVSETEDYGCSSRSCSSFYEVTTKKPTAAITPTTPIPFTPSNLNLNSPSKKQNERLKVLVNESRVPITSIRSPNLANCVTLAQEACKDGYTVELELALSNFELLHSWGNHKIELLQNNTPTQRTSKSFYNYLLLDPKIIKRSNFSGSYLKSDVIKNGQKFQQFLKAIFYIGKGNGNRPLQHLVEAKVKLANIKKLTQSEKLERILEIWKSGQGIIVHSIFHHSAEREANVNEAAMLDAIGIGKGKQDLTNLRKGSYNGTPANQWSQKVKNQFGSFLLYKCFCSFVVSDPKVFLPQDV